MITQPFDWLLGKWFCGLIINACAYGFIRIFLSPHKVIEFFKGSK